MTIRWVEGEPWYKEVQKQLMTIRWVKGEPWYKEVQKAANDYQVGELRALVQGGPEGS